MNTELELIEGGDPISHQAAAWFARLRADDASEADRRQWRAWLAEDPRHCASYARLERLWSSLGHMRRRRRSPHACRRFRVLRRPRARA